MNAIKRLLLGIVLIALPVAAAILFFTGLPASGWLAAALGMAWLLAGIGRRLVHAPAAGLASSLRSVCLAMAVGIGAIATIQSLLTVIGNMDARWIWTVEEVLSRARSVIGELVSLRMLIAALALAILAKLYLPRLPAFSLLSTWRGRLSMGLNALLAATTFTFFTGQQAASIEADWVAQSEERAQYQEERSRESERKLVASAVVQAHLNAMTLLDRSTLSEAISDLRKVSNAEDSPRRAAEWVAGDASDTLTDRADDTAPVEKTSAHPSLQEAISKEKELRKRAAEATENEKIAIEAVNSLLGAVLPEQGPEFLRPFTDSLIESITELPLLKSVRLLEPTLAAAGNWIKQRGGALLSTKWNWTSAVVSTVQRIKQSPESGGRRPESEIEHEGSLRLPEPSDHEVPHVIR